MKRTCNDCRALTPYRGSFKCQLGYKTEPLYSGIDIYSNVIVGAKPLEECPKPRTYEEYMNALKNKRKVIK